MIDSMYEKSRGELRPLGIWTPTNSHPVFAGNDVVQRARRIRESVHIVAHPESGHLGLASGGEIKPGDFSVGQSGYFWMASLPPLYPEWLGDRSFTEAHGVRFPYVAGAMARGIASAQLVIEMARAGMLAFLGTAGLSPSRVARDLDTIEESIDASLLPWGANLIHSPNEPHVESELVDLYLQRGVTTVSASAFMKLTPPLVRYACTGLRADQQGRIQRRNHVVAKISRAEVARRFMQPPPEAMLRDLVQSGRLTEEEARLASHLPIAGDITAESDSGGHTDGRTLSALLPAMTKLAAEVRTKQGYDRAIRVGAAGGIGTPTAVASAFSLGASFVLTGSINQCTVEAGVAPSARAMLANAEQTDVALAPSADMFEIGAKVQVLSRGTMFASRANRLDKLYRTCDGLDDIPDSERGRLEKQIFGASIDEIWKQTRDFWQQEDPSQLERARQNPRHKMALVFRWYLGKSSRWPIDGTTKRQLDYQLWCGPAMGAFNQWVQGSFLEDTEQRRVVQIAHNLMEGAAQITRAHQLRTYGVPVPTAAFEFEPRPLH